MISIKLSLFVKNNQFLAVIDQVTLSLASFITAFVLIKVAGVESFGVYSFLMVLCVLVNGVFSSLLHGQMTLRISGSGRRIQDSTFRSTFEIYIVFYLFGALIVLLTIGLLRGNSFIDKYFIEIILAILYTFFLSLFDLFRKFLYVLNRQDLSLACTLLFFTTLILSLGLVYLYADLNNAVAYVFISLFMSNFVAVIFNSKSIGAIIHGRKVNLRTSRLLFLRYFDQGKFGFLGMLVTWVQNQGITPFLMAVAGPVVVGYFSLARLITVPVTVINTGITSSALPKLRQLYKKNDIAEVSKKISQYMLLNFCLAVGYFTIILLVHLSGLFDKFIPEYNNIKVFLLLWSFVCVAIMYRAWITQFFVVAMEFKYLLKVGAIAATFSYLAMILGYTSLRTYYIVPLGVLGGEILLSLLLLKAKSSAENGRAHV